MKKIVKLVCITAILLLAFGLFACTTSDVSDNSLAEYKTTAKTALETYANGKGQDNYSVDNWAVIGKIAAAGKTAMDVSANKDGVESVIAVTKQAIDTVPKKEDSALAGCFYSLEEACAKDFITKEVVKHISYFLYGEVKEVADDAGEDWNSIDWPAIDFTPQIETPVLNQKIASDLKKAFYEGHLNDFNRNDGGVEDITITKFLGEYNGNFVVEMKVSFLDGGMSALPYCVDGIIFYDSGSSFISIFVTTPN